MQAEARAAAAYITELAQRVTTVAFQSAGGGALFDTNPLQRCFRDVHTATQHGALAPRTLEVVGRVLLGLDPQGLL